MATLAILPIQVQSTGGYSVELTSVETGPTDNLIGTIVTPGGGKKNATWDENGRMRDGTDSCNLDMSDPKLIAVGIAARAFRASDA